MPGRFILILDYDKPCEPHRTLNPYDTDDRAEPTIWPLDGADRDRYGRVDFDDDEGSTVATVYLERNDEGVYVVHIDTAQRLLVSIDPH